MSTRWTDPDAPTAGELARDVRRGRTDPVELVERALARLGECDGEVGAFVHVDAAGALAQARERAAHLRRGDPLGPLHGVPVAVKDLFDVAGQVTRAGSLVPPGPPAASDAVAVARLRAAGAVVLGRTRTHEFAWGLTTQHAVLGGTRNPWDTRRVPGGSSGGSAAAVAAGVVPLALGTDTGCSIRLPAAWCGLVGHKPTYGAVPVDGVLPLAPSLDHVGALARDVADARLALSVLSGSAAAGASRGADGSVAALRVGVVAARGLTAGVARAVGVGVARAAELGARLEPVALPMADDVQELYRVVQGIEALAWHRGTGRWPRHAAAYGRDVRERLARCEQLTPDQARQAGALRTQLRQQWSALLTRVDLVLLPVAGAGPPRTDAPELVDLDGRPGELRAAVLPWTLPANLCGLPACSVPVGTDDDGLPVGLQVVGPPSADERVLALAGQLNRARPAP